MSSINLSRKQMKKLEEQATEECGFETNTYSWYDRLAENSNNYTPLYLMIWRGLWLPVLLTLGLTLYLFTRIS